MAQSTLSNASSGDRCVVVELASEPPELKSRLYALGIIPGSSFELLRFAPLRDPMQVKISGSFLSIRRTVPNIITGEKQ